jgi:hypothetical protein
MSIILSEVDLRAIQDAIHPQLALVLKMGVQKNRLTKYSVESLDDVAAIVDGLNDNRRGERQSVIPGVEPHDKNKIE